MKRIAFLWVIFLLAGPVAAASALSPRSRAAAASPPRAQLTAFACRKAAQQSERSVSVRAVMRPVTGTERLEMRFELLSKSGPAAAAVEVSGVGLDSWISPTNPTLGQRSGDVWLVPDVVRNLPAPALYRYRVSFRWIGTDGRVLSTQALESRDCHESAYQPDLLVSSIAIEPAKKATKGEYVATIENDGQVPAVGPFTVTFTPGAAATPGAVPTSMSKTIDHLDAGPENAVQVTFTGPTCTAADAPTVVVDPEHAVQESNFANNSLTVAPTCPALTSAPAGSS